jgi:hypothetical protein
VGVAQWFVLRQFIQRAPVWIPALALIYVAAWYLTSLVIGESTIEGFYVFGASGALVQQALTGLVLWWLLGASGEVKGGLSALLPQRTVKPVFDHPQPNQFQFPNRAEKR